jgi:four helix bundle protein
LEENMADKKKIRSFRDLLVWQKAFQLCLEVYRVTRTFPADERFGLIAEMRKTSRSVPCNIAEGHQRHTTAEYLRFLDIASGSRAELETQVLLAQALGYAPHADSDTLLDSCQQVAKLLAALARALRSKAGPAKP